MLMKSSSHTLIIIKPPLKLFKTYVKTIKFEIILCFRNTFVHGSPIKRVFHF